MPGSFAWRRGVISQRWRPGQAVIDDLFVTAFFIQQNIEKTIQEALVLFTAAATVTTRTLLLPSSNIIVTVIGIAVIIVTEIILLVVTT